MFLEVKKKRLCEKSILKEVSKRRGLAIEHHCETLPSLAYAGTIRVAKQYKVMTLNKF